MKHSYWFLFGLVFFSISCDSDESEPAYPAVPFIESSQLDFVPGALTGQSRTDTIKLTFKFRDGDFDLGLMQTDIDSPYHRVNFFLENSGVLSKMVTKKVYEDVKPLLSPRQSGKLATYRHLKNEMLSPPALNLCVNYLYEQELFISSVHQSVVDEESIAEILTKSGRPDIFRLADTVLIEHNRHHHNILITYLVEQPDGSFSPFDFQKQYCSTFDGRFPYLVGTWSAPTIKYGPFSVRRYSKQRGQMIYSMMSVGFRPLFGGKRIKVRFSIKDRALNESNVLETEPLLIPN